MSKPRDPRPVKLLMALLYARPEYANQIRDRLESLFGPQELESDEFEFDHTDYYTQEMGEGLRKKLVSFLRPVRPEDLPEIKLYTNDLEREFSSENRRRINIDPGYLTFDRLVLATGKDSAHRIYLRDGIYAEVTLLYQSGAFLPLPWTYPDYRRTELGKFLHRVREQYKKQVN